MVAAVNLFRILNLFRSETIRWLLARKTAPGSPPAVSRHYFQFTKPAHSRNKFFGGQAADSGPNRPFQARPHTGASRGLPHAPLVGLLVSIRRTNEEPSFEAVAPQLPRRELRTPSAACSWRAEL
jgi:hypothetical protein